MTPAAPGPHSGEVTTWTLTEVDPTPADQPLPWGVLGMERVSRACERELWGYEDNAYSAPWLASRLREQTYVRRVYLVATAAERVGEADAVVGFGVALMPAEGNDHLAELELWVHPDHRGRGVGRMLAEAVERAAAEAGRGTWLAVTEHDGEPPVDDPAALVPPTGAGRIAADDRAARFVAARGYALEQGERYSVLDLPVDPDLVERLHADALGHADGYHLIRWTDAVPEQWLDPLCVLLTRMTTDTPQGDLDLREETWTAERARTYERQTAEAGRRYAGVGAVHTATGVLAGATLVELDPRIPELVDQGDTIVLREHRGHRLGMAIKTEMLHYLAEIAPAARHVHTWNAEENAHMLGINVALGFRPRGVIGLWQRTVDALHPVPAEQDEPGA